MIREFTTEDQTIVFDFTNDPSFFGLWYVVYGTWPLDLHLGQTELFSGFPCLHKEFPLIGSSWCIASGRWNQACHGAWRCDSWHVVCHGACVANGMWSNISLSWIFLFNSFDSFFLRLISSPLIMVFRNGRTRWRWTTSLVGF